MKTFKALVLVVVMVLMSDSVALAQDATNSAPDAAQKAANLRAQLLEVQDQESELQLRVKQLDYDLKPENIRNYFAGVGSLHPEEMREQRRLQLQNEKDRALARLDNLAATRQRLETAIQAADAEAFQQSMQSATARQSGQMLATDFLGKHALALALAMMAVGGCLLLIAFVRWRSSH
jgi:uncharacterized protein YlxW (UPF0749 family)